MNMQGPKHRWRNKTWDYSGVTPYQLQELGVSSVQELQAARDARQAARKALADFLARKDVSGPEKHRARCAFIHKHLRLPYQCTGCWLLPGNCVCNKLRTAKPKTKVVIHLHQDEWGRGSNTGCLCGKSLADAELLLKGHAPHDEQLSALLSDPDYTTALLWPGDDALEPQQLQELAAARSNGRIALVAIDATWNCAIKMRRRFPEDMLTVRLPPDLALPQQHHVAAAGISYQSMRPEDSIHQPGTPTAAAGSTTSSTSSSRSRSSSPQQEPGESIPVISSMQAGVSTASSSSGAGSSPAAAVNKTAKHVPKPGEAVSLFRGIRQYHGSAAANGRVSTLEAVAAALLALEGDEEMYQGLLYNLALKVDAMRQQKHMPGMPLVCDMSAAESGDGASDEP